ncbi:hypothetical protein [Clostridium ljungdahlii]
MSIFERKEWNEISNLIIKCWKHYNSVKSNNFIVKPSIPVLWFGT